MNEIRICPVCNRKYEQKNRLQQYDKRLVCPLKHSFDLSASGYVNLLPPSAGLHGDNREMIRSRRDLLNTGIYEPLQKALCEEVTALLPAEAILWDSGCGEGYYTAALADCGRNYQTYGSDLSTAALIESRKRSSALILSAASAYDLPVADHSCDAVICLFAPEAISEFKRILKPGGLLALGIPGKRHLFGLKQILYTTPYENAPRSAALSGFSLQKNRELCYKRTISDPKLIRSLFEMTPYAYHTSPEGHARLAALQTLTTEIHFHLLIYTAAESDADQISPC